MSCEERKEYAINESNTPSALNAYTRTPNSAGARMASTCGSSPSPTKLCGGGTMYDERREGALVLLKTHMVETPASIAEESVSAAVAGIR